MQEFTLEEVINRLVTALSTGHPLTKRKSAIFDVMVGIRNNCRIQLNNGDLLIFNSKDEAAEFINEWVNRLYINVQLQKDNLESGEIWYKILVTEFVKEDLVTAARGTLIKSDYVRTIDDILNLSWIKEKASAPAFQSWSLQRCVGDGVVLVANYDHNAQWAQRPCAIIQGASYTELLDLI